MNAALVAARAIHFAATMLVFGELVFVVFVAGKRWRYAAASATHVHDTLDRHAFLFVAWALVAAAVSGGAWLLLQSTQMAGATIAEVLRDGTPLVVLRQTEFGRGFLVRALLWIALAASVVWIQRRGKASRVPTAMALVLAAPFLGVLADAGHAAAATGTLRAVHLGADAAHLLAAGAWLGALPPLVLCLAHAPPGEALARLAMRFSVLGMACVAVLIASGVVNSLFLVGSFTALFGTAYGQLLDAKLVLFAAMLALAATNRSRWTPRLAEDDIARRSLARNAKLEIAGGIVIVAIVGALGAMIPGAHQSPRWPFGFALDFAQDRLSSGSRVLLVASLVVAFGAMTIIIVGMRRRIPRWSIVGCIALLVSLAASTSIFAVPAFPTTYATSPVAYTVDAVARGAARFARHCSSCHGPDARGDGPAAASLAVKPANLAEHALHHPEGNLFWWIAHGIAGTPMPAFSPQLDDDEIWEIVQFLVARASAEAATPVGPRVDARSMSRVPDFGYEVAGRGQRALAGERTPALIVLYSTSASDARIAQLTSDARLAHEGLRVIPILLAESSKSGEAASADSSAARVYRMFAGAAGSAPASHVELLIDRALVLRARWTGIPGDGSERDAQIARAVQALPASSGVPASAHHGHH